MQGWQDVGAVADFQAGTGRRVEVDGESVVVFSGAGHLYAVLDSCPHAGMPLAGAQCRGTVITCAFHNFAYDLRTGRNIDYPYDEPGLRKLQLRVQDGRVLIGRRSQRPASPKT